MLREVWLNIRVEKIDMYEGVMIKALLDSGTMGMFMDRQMAARHGFKLQKLERPIAVRNVDSINNVREPLIHDSGARSTPPERSCNRSNITT